MKCSEQNETIEIEAVILGKTTIGEQVDETLLAYIVRSEETIYVDSLHMDRVAGHLGAKLDNGFIVVRKGEPFKGGVGFTLKCAIKPLKELPTKMNVEIGDCKVMKGMVCTLRAPGTCVNASTRDGEFVRSFKAPWYGVSLCVYSSNETCDAWLAKEFVDTYTKRDCKPPPPVNEEISAWVCSMP